MKDNRINGSEELEKELRKRMSELSSHVDCFEKISARAFPERDNDFEDSELTVSDLENVTGRRRGGAVLKWVSIAAAVVVCLGVVPKTVFFQELFSGLGTDMNKRFRSIISELNHETEVNDYKVYDMPLSEYISDDILVSPLYGCPFEADDTDGINVRVFVREIKGYPTNQIYAVEYTGDYSESNFLAAAESKAKFTDEDINSIGSFSNTDFGSENEAFWAASNAFKGDKYLLLVDRDGKRVTAASFTYSYFFKHDDVIKKLQTQVLYCKYDEDTEKYYYDTLTSCRDDNSHSFIVYDMPEAKELWKASLNYDGSSAMPKESKSDFCKKDFFKNTEERYDNETVSWYEPYNLADDSLVDDEVQTMIFGEIVTQKIFKVPADSSMKRTMRMYEPYLTHFTYSSQSDPTIDISIDGRDEQIIVHSGNIRGEYAALGVKSEDTTNFIEFSGELFVEEREQMQKEAERNRQAHEETGISEDIEQQAESTTVVSDTFLFSTDAPYIFTFTE